MVVCACITGIRLSLGAWGSVASSLRMDCVRLQMERSLDMLKPCANTRWRSYHHYFAGGVCGLLLLLLSVCQVSVFCVLSSCLTLTEL